MLQHLLDANPGLDVPVKHQPDQIDTIFAHHIRNSEVAVHYLVDAVERILLVYDSVEKDA